MTSSTPAKEAYLGLAAIILMWGTSFAAIKIALTSTPIWGVVLIRLIIGAIVLTGWALYRGRRFPPLKDKRWLWFLVLGFMGYTLPFFLITTGQTHVSSGLAGILIGAMPIATVALAHFFVPGEGMTGQKLIGFLIGFAGVIMVIGPSALRDLGGEHFLSQLMIFGAALAYASNVIIARLAPETPPSVAGAGMLIGAVIWALPLGIWQISQMDALAHLDASLCILWLGLVPTGIASVIYMQLIRTAGPSFFSQVNYFVPVMAALIGVAMGEPLGWSAFIALGVILAGVWIAKRPAKATTP
ncbi:DMT family transporter [Woodsholea maritima]|uniref:DMT family transporter n=1 Tax=Woodsholea maritima TaxID=240237 RepID=UPI0003728AF8|nr:DMT family transporter [Woodsholea maritima]